MTQPGGAGYTNRSEGVLVQGKKRNMTLILLGLIVAVSMSSIDQTIVSLSYSAIQSGLGLDSAGVAWIVNSYLLAAAAFFPLAGRLSDIIGYKRMMLLGIVAFGAGSLLCGLGPQNSIALTWMIASRVIQGIGLACMFPSAVGIIFTYSPVDKRAKSMAQFFAITGAMTAVGPIAGSYLIAFSWRYVFFINIPLAVAALLLTAWLTPRDEVLVSSRTSGHLDWPGAVLAALAMIALIVPLQQGASVGWTDLRIIGSLIISVGLIIAFVAVEMQSTNPVMNVKVFRNFRFSLSALASLIASVVFIPIMFFLSVYGQLSLNLSVGNASLLILYFFIGFMIAAQLGAKRFGRHGIRSVFIVSGILTIIGFSGIASAVTATKSGVPVQTGNLNVMIGLAGAGVGYMFSPAATDMVNRAIDASYGEVTALSQLLKNFGGALGMAVLSAISSSAFTDKLYSGLHTYGISWNDAQNIANSIGSGSGSHSSSQLSSLPEQIQTEIMNIVRASYASSASRVFTVMACAGVLFIIIAMLYPREEIVVFDDTTNTAASE
ncbi:MFS transporter [Bifidobacterium sp.]|jgi:EmrB/QacA subfamily drug resistance transporter|uniref:MFS transporter n=1 Tax=Bifidobacterium sp. TaxID=41200 RepID=UPI0025BDE72E|nr:MFS transporter [Bifidobacterium sp.]MCI1636235.1 MFS transporter [Bifidobacterium sp.]